MVDLKHSWKVFFILVILWSVVDVSSASVCTPTTFRPGLQDPKKPDVSKYHLYEVKVEANIINKNYTTDYTIYFDYANRRAAERVATAGSETMTIFNFDTNELLATQRSSGVGMPVCNVSSLATSSKLFLYGHQTGPENASIFEAGIFHYANSHSEQWIKRTNVRGTPCNLWRSCLSLPNLNATMIVDWYFSVPGWMTPLLDQIPVCAHVSGVRSSRPGMSRSFEHVYDFVDFNNNVVDSNVFKTPEGTYCPGKKSTLPLPTLPNIFHTSSEISDVTSQRINGYELHYDYTQNIIRFDGVNDLHNTYQTLIMDFYTGLTITIDRSRGNCSVAKIDPTSFSATATGGDPKHVRMRTPREFFYFDKGDYIYEGTRVARDILCHVWIGRRTDWPPNLSDAPTTTWEWYFATSNYTEDVPTTLKPIKLEMNAAALGIQSIYNIYEFDERKTIFWDMDIDLCLNVTDKRDFTFILTEQYKSSGKVDLEALKYAIHTAVKTESGILSSLRINNIKVDLVTSTNIKVSLTLLDRFTSLGNVANQQAEPDLKTAANVLTKSITDGSFNVTMTTGKENKQMVMVAKPDSLTVTEGV